MPIYAYRCNSCETEFDEFSFEPQAADEMSPACPECDGEDTERIISSVRVHAPARHTNAEEIRQAEEQAAQEQARSRQQLDRSLRGPGQ